MYKTIDLDIKAGAVLVSGALVVAVSLATRPPDESLAADRGRDAGH